MRVSLNKQEEVKKQLYALSRRYKEVFILDSCNINPAMDLSRFKWLAGFGCAKELSLQDPGGALDQIDQFIKKGHWCFGVLSYDLRYAVEQLSNHSPALHQSPLALLVEPAWVVGCKKDGNLFYHGISEAQLDGLLSEVVQVDDSKKQPISFEHLTDRRSYIEYVNAIKQEIARGNVYEMNYCIQLEALWPEKMDDLSIHLHRLHLNPAPFSAYVKNGRHRLLSSSPERYLYKDGNHIYSQPIKGTLPRAANAQEDDLLKQQLQLDEKFRAENVMIVDLVRNDLAKISETGSVQVDELFGVYPFAFVFQLISTVSATLKADIGLSDLIKASFPMGSMTGAPKIAAMEFIEQFEAYKRHWYSGSVFYVNPEGNMDSNVVIRSLQLDMDAQRMTYGVGGAITFDSVAEKEYEECKDKIKGI